jgi:hypothetical protein
VRRALELRTLRLREWASSHVGFQLLDARPEDAFIVSFPRSGCTWLRTVCSNVLVPWGRANPDVFNSLIPGATIRGALRARRLTSPRVVASHAPYRRGLGRVVYVVRDGRDALVSLYHYRIVRAGRAAEVSFPTFLAEHLAGEHGVSWHSHVEGWLRAGRAELGDRLLLVRYEDVLADPHPHVRRVLDFLAVRATDAEVDAAIDGASLNTMRAVEARRLGGPLATERSFYRSGTATHGAGWFDADMLARFEEGAGAALALGGYASMLEHTP